MAFFLNFRKKDFLEAFTTYTREGLVADTNENKEERFDTALRKLCQLIINYSHGMLINGLSCRLSDERIQKWSLQKYFQVLHLTQCTLPLFFSYQSGDVVPMIGIAKSTLATASVVVLDDDGNLLIKNAPDMTVDEVSVLFRFKEKELSQQCGGFFNRTSAVRSLKTEDVGTFSKQLRSSPKVLWLKSF